MEAENKLYAYTQGDGSGPSSQEPPAYTPSVPQPPGPAHGYSSNVAGSPYYAPPSGAGYGGGYGAPPSQQQQQVTVVTANQPQMLYVYPTETYSGAVAYACVVLWCCNCIFGLIAYLLAGEQTIFFSLSQLIFSILTLTKRTPAARYMHQGGLC